MAGLSMNPSVRGILRIAVVCAICCVGLTLGQAGSYRQQGRQQQDAGRERAPKHDQMTEEPPSTDEPMTTSSSRGTTTQEPTPPTTPYNPYSLENTSRAHRKAMRLARKGKSRRKRRGCKCVGRYMQDVEKMMDTKIKQFKDMYLIPKLKDSNSQRMRDALLRLSGDVDETKNGLRKLTDSMAELLDDFQSRQRDVDRTARHVNRLSSAVANLSNYVDNMERRIASSGHKTSRIRARHSHQAANQVSDIETSTPAKPPPTQCNDMLRNGYVQFNGDYYTTLQPRGAPHSFRALCRLANNSGWTVIQRRIDGSVDFYRNWDDYRTGFGVLEGEFWLGNDYIHYLTTQEDMMLRIEMQNWDGEDFYAVYDHFRVDGAREHYKLHISGYHGDAGDAMNSLWENHDGMPFSTKDKDNDARYYDSCAKHYQGAWWFNNCFEAHLNGKYYTKGFHKNYFQRDGIQWNTIHMYSSLKRVTMMVKPADKKARTG